MEKINPNKISEKGTGFYFGLAYLHTLAIAGLATVRVISDFNGTMVGNFLKKALMICVFLVPFRLIAQVKKTRPPIILAPQFSYASPQVYVAGTNITPLMPTSTGGAVPAPGTYNNPLTLVTQAANEIISGVTVDPSGYTSGYVYYGNTIAKPTDPSGEIWDVYAETLGDTTQYYKSNSFYEGGSAMSIGMDPNGDLYMNNGALSEAPTGANTFAQVIPLCGQTYAPDGVAGSAAGFIYVAEGSKHLITEFVKGVEYQAPVTFSSALSDPVGVAVDAAGNVYAVDNTLPYVTEFKANGTVVHLGTGLSSAWGIVVDAAGNLFVADSGNGVIKEYPSGGSAFITIGPGSANALANPKDLAVDAADNLYIIDYGANNSPRTLKYMQRFTGYTISPALPAGLSFNTTTGEISGTPTQITPTATYTISAVNAFGTGSTTLTITVNPAAPSFSYNTPDIFAAGQAITPLTPTNGNRVAAPGYTTDATNTKTIGSGFNQPVGVAADAAGNVYVADRGNNAVYEIPAGGGGNITLGSGFNLPYGVAVDAAGNVYVADTYNNAIKKIPVGGGAPAIIGSGFSFPTGVAVDAAGNVYVADYGNNAIKKIPVGGGNIITLASGFSNPEGVAVDAAGNVYVADTGNNEVKEIPAGGGNIVFIGSGYSTPTSVACDGAGNLYVADFYNFEVKYIASGSAPVVIGSGFYNPAAVAVNGTGKVYVSDASQSAIFQISPVGGFFISPALPAGLSFNNTTGIISGTPTAAQAATPYVVTGYNVTGQDIATISMAVIIRPNVVYQSPKTYSLGAPITPLTPTSSNVAPQGYSSTAVDMNLGAAFPTYPTYLVFDPNGNLYVAEGGENYITEIFKNGDPPVTINTGVLNVSGIASDALGNIYLSNYTGNSIVKVPVFRWMAPTTLISGLNGPVGIAVDTSGNIYEADYNSNTIQKFTAAGVSVGSVGSGFGHPWGIALDAAGNLYVADAGNNAVKEIPAGGGAVITLATNFSVPTGVAVDASGNIFISDHNNNLIKELRAGSTTPITIGPSINSPMGLAVDQAGNVDIASLQHYAVYQVQPSGGYYLNTALPAGLKLSNATGIISGAPTVVSPANDYTVTAWGNGYGAQAVVNIRVTAALSSNAGLDNISLTRGAVLSPAFARGTLSYTSSVHSNYASINLTPTTSDANATVTVDGVAVPSGSPSQTLPLVVGDNVVTVVVTAQDGITTKTYTVTITRPSANATLSNLKLNLGTLSPAFASATTGYTQSVGNGVTIVKVIPTTTNANATITVNGMATVSGQESSPIALNVGDNIITTIVTAQDGVTTDTYTITVTRAPSSNAGLDNISLTRGAVLSPAFARGTLSYTSSVRPAYASINLTPVASDATAAITVNGVAVPSGSPSQTLPLVVGDNVVTVVVTAQDGITTKTYTVTITRPSANATLSNLKLNLGALSPAFASATTGYTQSVGNGVTIVKVIPTTTNANATITVNGMATVSGKESPHIALNVGDNIITTIVTAQDGVTTDTYTITVTRAMAPMNSLYEPVGVVKPAGQPQLADDGIVVHQGVSPNGDGINDVLTIDGITNYPDNKLMIMSPNGLLVYETKGYDNNARVFDGHSNKTGLMQQPGTYFYSLDYTVKGITKHKTGFIVLKY